MIELLCWDRCDAHLPHIRVSRHRFSAGQRGDLHRHDFTEWFWLESGQIRHLTNGSDELLTTGAARFLVAGQIHGFACDDEAILVTISIPQSAFADLRRRLGSSPGWPWPSHGMGHRLLDRAQLAAMAGAMADLPSHGQDVADREWFVAGMIRILRSQALVQRDAAIPPWLIKAVATVNQPQHLATGLPQLIRLCDRSSAHVSRAVRRHYGCTATAMVNRLRLEHAARELRLGQRSIADIALACGFGNLGHFYRQFRAQFAVTPRAYRFAAVGR